MNIIVEADAHGIVMSQLASEFLTLSEDERKRMTEILVDVFGGRIPLVIGIQTVSTDLAVDYAKDAFDRGADGVIVLPPYLHTEGDEMIYNYFKAISDIIEIPVFIQTGGSPLGSSL